jgi:dTDP-4-dehydrorhamnose 3,5-epimerase-like enzyme
MMQNDVILADSIIEITTSSKRNHRQISIVHNLTFDFYLISNKTCVLSICLNQFQIHANNQLSDENRTISFVRYEQRNSNNTIHIFWFQYRLPNIIQSGTFR